MKNIVIIGAGNIGSRHLQALKAVKEALKIFVIDPNIKSLNEAKEKYLLMHSNNNQHEIEFFQEIIEFNEEIDIAIVATCSDIRRQIIENLLKLNTVKYFILEKILFQKVEDYDKIKDLFRKKKCKAWVNCTRRIIPIYKEEIKSWFYKKKFIFSVTGSNWGLMSNIIHYLDYMVLLLEDYDFIIDSTYLNPISIQSKRKEFLEFTGLLQVHFKNGSHGIFQCFPTGKLPLIEEIVSDSLRAQIFWEDLNLKVWNHKNNLKWDQYEIKMVYTSELTTGVVEEILNEYKCSLTSFDDSMKIHLKLYNQIINFLNINSDIKYNYYPFT